MSVLDRAALEASPLADLHTIASELSIDGYRRLRKEELIDAILTRQQDGGQEAPVERDEAPVDRDEAPVEEDEAPVEEDEPPAPPRRRGRRGGRGRGATREETADDVQEPAAGDEPSVSEEPEVIEGVVELLSNGSGFVRVAPPDPSDDDVYISAAQVKRCELVSGDRVAGPRRAPRRSERFASLTRIDTINDRPASEFADTARFDELPAVFPDERLRLGSDDPTLKAIEWLTPFGRGSRVAIVGESRSGKTEALRRLTQALADQDELQLFVALAGVRPEEIADWGRGPVAPAAAVSFAASSDAQDHAVELVVDQARRLTARGIHTVVLIDTLDGVHHAAARRAMAAARNILEGGSLTIVATSSEPIGGETTVIALDVALASEGRFPAIDLARSGTLRPELLVGEAGAEAIARSRVEVLEPPAGD